MEDCQAKPRVARGRSAATLWPAGAAHRASDSLEGAEQESGLPGLLAAVRARLEQGLQRTEALELLLVGLHHLFRQLATLYLQRLPTLAETTRPLVEGLIPPDYLPVRHAIWLALGEVSRDLFH